MASSSPGVCCSAHCEECCNNHCDGQEKYPLNFFTAQQELDCSFAELNALYSAHYHASVDAVRERRAHPPPPRRATGSNPPRAKRRKAKRWYCTGTLRHGGKCGKSGKESVLEKHLHPVDMVQHEVAGGCDGGVGKTLISPWGRRLVVEEAD